MAEESEDDATSDGESIKLCKEIVSNELDAHCSWLWDRASLSSNACLSENGREVLFHPSVSRGTAAVRGSLGISEGICTWIIKLGPHVYGTDMVVGVCTEELNLSASLTSYKSLIGDDEFGWGLSYRGVRRHAGHEVSGPHCAFDAHAEVRLELDTLSQQLSVSVDGSPMKLAFSNLYERGHCALFPVVASTAASTRMRLLHSDVLELRLEHLCLGMIRRSVSHKSHIDSLPLPSSLKKSLKSGWIDNRSL